MSTLAISEYALLSNCHTAALVSRFGSIDWLCFPRFDAPSLFARLLDDDGGHWSIRPVGEAQISRRYLERSLVLETTLRVDDNVCVVVDALSLGRGDRGHRLGATSPRVLLRQARCLKGTMDLAVEFMPRPEYGVVHPRLTALDGVLEARGGADILALSTPLPFEVEGATARASVHLRQGDAVGFALQHRASDETPIPIWTQGEISRRLAGTVKTWRSWSALHQKYEGPWQELVHCSGRVLQGLSFFPTGAIVAAPTTSLPEAAGGPRNWDYRYTWVRDASFTLEALWIAACNEEAHRFFSFIANAAATQLHRNGDLQIMFGIGGENDLSERELGHLRGWRASRPVRVGNGAWNQRQNDVYGELLSAVYRFRDQLAGGLDLQTKQFLAGLADQAAAKWRAPDRGIWEVRGEARHFVHSKLMCWVALDRAVRLAELLEAEPRVAQWSATRDQIRDEILRRGWSDRAQAFTQAFDSDELDAAVLNMPLVGFIAADEPRMRATIDAIANRLTDARGLVYRYRAHDGLSGDEGTFLLCTFWLAEALALAGEIDRATETFTRAAAFANDLGLLAEEVDSRTGELLGNFPQAFSHIGLINAAAAIAKASATRESD